MKKMLMMVVALICNTQAHGDEVDVVLNENNEISNVTLSEQKTSVNLNDNNINENLIRESLLTIEFSSEDTVCKSCSCSPSN